MAHGVESAYYADRPAWHGVGTVVQGARSSAEAMALAGATWQVTKRPAFTQDDDGHYVPMPGRYAVTRSLPDGTIRVLGDVGEAWTPFQNDAAAAFLDALVDTGDLRYESVLVLHEGRVLVLLARRPNDLIIGDDDRSTPYLGLINSHDGSKALTVRPFVTRIVCANTLVVGLRERTQHTWRIRHTGSLNGRIDEARRTLRLHYAYEQAWQQEMDRLLHAPYTEGQYRDMVRQILPVPDRTDHTRTHPNVERRRVLINNYHATSTVDPTVRATRWGALNIATEALEHATRVQQRRGVSPAERRLTSTLFGTIAEQRQAVYDHLVRT